MVALSMATERVTEAIKGFPILSFLLSQEQKGHEYREEARKAAIHIIAIGVGTSFAWGVHGPITRGLNLDASTVHWPLWLLLGGLASGGSGMWNSALDLVRTYNQQQQAVFQGTIAPTISGITPSHATATTNVNISGTGFGAAQGSVTFNGVGAAPANWTNTAIIVAVPAGATSGNVVVTTAAGVASRGFPFIIP
jgi:hypothetical protein